MIMSVDVMCGILLCWIIVGMWMIPESEFASSTPGNLLGTIGVILFLIAILVHRLSPFASMTYLPVGIRVGAGVFLGWELVSVMRPKKAYTASRFFQSLVGILLMSCAALGVF